MIPVSVFTRTQIEAMPPKTLEWGDRVYQRFDKYFTSATTDDPTVWAVFSVAPRRDEKLVHVFQGRTDAERYVEKKRTEGNWLGWRYVRYPYL